jgi:hypothetical protein
MPTIASGSTVSDYAGTYPTIGHGVPDTTSFAAGDLLRVEIPSGTFTTAADLTVQVFAF